MDGWVELEALIGALREGNAAWAESADKLANEASSLGKLVEDVERHYGELGVRDALQALADRALAGAASVYEARRAFGYTRTATLAWQAADDPRAALAGEAASSWLSVDVLIGPRVLIDAGAAAAPDDRLAVVIAGEKRLVATLPTSREKFRGALLRAFAAPRREAKAASGGGPTDAGSVPPTEPADAAVPAGAAPTGAARDGSAHEAGINAAASFAQDVAADRAGAPPEHTAEPTEATSDAQQTPTAPAPDAAPGEPAAYDEAANGGSEAAEPKRDGAAGGETVIELPGAGGPAATPPEGPPSGG